MHTILIAHRNVAFGERLAALLRAGAYRVITCPGPWPPQRCVRCDIGYCPLTEGADLMIYDPHLTTLDADAQPYHLAVSSALAHPDIPLLLAWPPSETPDAGTLRSIRVQAEHIRLAECEPAALVRQVNTLLAPAAAPTR